MTDTLLHSLREHVVDESQPLAGLLRKCLLLGAETGSDALRDWARKELTGYGDEDEVPKYREVPCPAMSMNSMSGSTWTANQSISRLQMPRETWEYLPDTLPFTEPIEQLQQLSEQKSLNFTSEGLAAAQAVWNKKLGPFQQIMSLSFVVSGSVIAGILGQVRTHLVDIVADLTSENPLSELPEKGKVDAAVSNHVGDIYNTTIRTAAGPVAIGAKAQATTQGLTVEGTLGLLDKVQEAAADIADAQRTELLDALADLRATVESEAPDTGDVVKKVGKMRALADKVGLPSVAAAAGGAAQAITELAVSGAFG
ncbi:AbiTii domain-containing protein [Couchioplanes caeruleus]|uniref:AbiTii domain-containing protein n=1 Tax=Couchioplanes caeruleus TaxID=56438 RepID=UPI0008FF122B|nr:hypothetical protein [Couchioplanes caeruleus]